MKSLTNLVAAGALIAASAVSAGAQVSYTTTGRFTSANANCNQAAAITSVVCVLQGYNLTFTGTSAVSVGSGSIISLGTFSLTGNGSAVASPGTVSFALFISQTAPTIGTNSYVGTVYGTITTGVNGGVSTLEWDPNQSISIGSTNYQIIYDNVGPAADRGLGIPVNNDRGVNAIVTTGIVPEPATLALMGAGMLVLAGIAKTTRRV